MQSIYEVISADPFPTLLRLPVSHSIDKAQNGTLFNNAYYDDSPDLYKFIRSSEASNPEEINIRSDELYPYLKEPPFLSLNRQCSNQVEVNCQETGSAVSLFIGFSH